MLNFLGGFLIISALISMPVIIVYFIYSFFKNKEKIKITGMFLLVSMLLFFIGAGIVSATSIKEFFSVIFVTIGFISGIIFIPLTIYSFMKKKEMAKKAGLIVLGSFLLIIFGVALDDTPQSVIDSKVAERESKKAEELSEREETNTENFKEESITQAEKKELAKLETEKEEQIRKEVEKEEQTIIENEKLAKLKKRFMSAKVTKHVDGDTVHVTTDSGQVLKIRMIGVDTPETVHPSKPVEFYGKEASDFTKENLFGKTVYLEKDVSDTDRYGRSLRYIWIDVPQEITKEEIKTKMFNGMLVARGFANSSTYQPDIKYQEYFSDFQREARNKNLGLWDEKRLAEFEAPSTNKVENNKSNGVGQNNGNSNTPNETNKTNVENTTPTTDAVYEVFITNTGTKYHKSGCRHLKSSSIPISKKEATSQGYEPCKVCKP